MKAKTPNAEVADIDKTDPRRARRYRISFGEPGKNPTMYIAEDGSVVQNLQSEKPATEHLSQGK